MSGARTGGATLRFPPANGLPANRLIILLHGVGSSAAAMAPLARPIASLLPDAAIAIPDGFEAFDMGGNGFQWFSIGGVTETNRPERVENALPRLEALIESEQAHAGLGPAQTAVAGFSQGAIMALRLATSERPPAAIVSLAGRLAGSLAPKGDRRPAIFLSHGLADPVIAPAELEVAAAALRATGCSVDTDRVAGHNHSIDASQIDRMARHIAAAIPVP